MLHCFHSPECTKLVALHHSPRRGQQQGKCEVGGGLREHVGRVGHQDAFAGCGGHIDVVESHGDVRDDPDPLQPFDDLGA